MLPTTRAYWIGWASGTLTGLTLGLIVSTATAPRAQGLIDIETQIELNYRDLQREVDRPMDFPPIPNSWSDPCGSYR